MAAIERAWDGDRRREFDAHELLIFAMVFDLPMIWFLLPPKGDHRLMRGTTRQVDEMRRGEVLGLRWADVDLDAGRLAVRHTIGRVGGKVMAGEPKTAKSKRSIALDPATVAVLRRHRIAQLEERLEWGGLHQDRDLVFAREDGAPVHPEAIGRALRGIAKAAGVRPVRTHDLRHGWATAALEAGVHPKVVSDRLGHSKVSVTLDVYSHVAPAVEEEAARLVASKLLGAPVAGPQ